MVKKIVIPHGSVFKLRTLSEIQRTASGFKSRIQIQKGKVAADAKSFIELVALLDAKDKKLEITADGEDAQEAVRTLLDLAVHGTS